MVVAAGYNPYDGILELYNPNGNPIQKNQTLKLSDTDEHNIIHLFNDIKINFSSNIQLFCVYLGPNYRNKFRKRFIQVANSFGIASIKIIGRQMALLQAALYNMPKYSEKEGTIWIFEIFSKWIYCNVWEAKKNDIWRLKRCFVQEKDKESLLTFVKSDDLKAMKEKLYPPFKTPLILVSCDYFNIQEHEKMEFKKIYSNYKKVFFTTSFKWSIWALNYLRKYPAASESLLERYITVMVDKEEIFKPEYSHSTPLQFSIKIPIEHSNVKLKVLEAGIDTETMIFGAEGIYEIKLIIDENGIYNISSNANAINENNHKINKKSYNMPPKTVGYYQASNAVGIDFGTTECCAAVIRNAGPDCVTLDLTTNLRTMPSYVAYDEKEPKCGQIAVDRIRYFGKCTVYDSKRMLGKTFDEIAIDSSWPFTITEFDETSCQIVLENKERTMLWTKSPEEISSSILKHIKQKVDEYQNKYLKEAVIAIPSEFTEKQKTALLTAALLAGWEIIHFIPEPIAAAFAYSTEMEFSDNSKLLLFDFGGGTVDVCIVNIASGNLQLLSFNGNYYLGGRDFDTLLYNHFDGILKHKYNIDVTVIKKKYLLLKKCQKIKHTLSVSNSYWLDISDFDCENDEQINISVNEFEAMASDNMTKISNVILSALEKAHLHKNDIDYVVQAGGGSRMPMIKKHLADMFPNSIHKCCKNPEWIISEGAALYAYYLEKKE
uniref:Heat shock protein 70 n=1 Tax=Panagrolaimus sp. PS1159 TaxID=55785 RepID=A0AC35GV20_9BILA